MLQWPQSAPAMLRHADGAQVPLQPCTRMHEIPHSAVQALQEACSPIPMGEHTVLPHGQPLRTSAARTRDLDFRRGKVVRFLLLGNGQETALGSRRARSTPVLALSIIKDARSTHRTARAEIACSGAEVDSQVIYVRYKGSAVPAVEDDSRDAAEGPVEVELQVLDGARADGRWRHEVAIDDVLITVGVTATIETWIPGAATDGHRYSGAYGCGSGQMSGIGSDLNISLKPAV